MQRCRCYYAWRTPRKSSPQLAPPQRSCAVRLEAGSAGDTAARREYLAQALSADPNDAAAHWQHGDVRLNGQWRSVEQLARDPARIRKMNDYRAQAAKAADTVYDHQKLAHYCGRVRLGEQEQFHFAHVLRLSPNSPEAIKKLGLVHVRGRYLTPAQVAAEERQQQLWKVTSEKWLPRLTALRQDAASDTATSRGSPGRGTQNPRP